VGRGIPLRIYDPALNLAAVTGANKRAIDTKMPALASLLKSSLSEAVGQAGLVVVAQKCVPLEDLRQRLTPQHQILDVNGWKELSGLPARYQGFCW